MHAIDVTGKILRLSGRGFFILVGLLVSSQSFNLRAQDQSASVGRNAVATPGQAEHRLQIDREKIESSDQENQRILDDSVRDVPDVPGLPSALLIGDSISMYLTRKTSQLLSGKVNVHRIPENGRSTRHGLEKIDQWLGTQHWDIIHFNWGLHDLLITKDGRNAVPPDEYEANLRKLVARLKRTGARLIWATTTPVPRNLRAGPGYGPLRRNSDVLIYNGIARRIMEKNGIAIDDLYALAAPRLADLQNFADVHYTPFGSNYLAKQVAAEILASAH